MIVFGFTAQSQTRNHQEKLQTNTCGPSNNNAFTAEREQECVVAHQAGVFTTPVWTSQNGPVLPWRPSSPSAPSCACRRWDSLGCTHTRTAGDRRDGWKQRHNSDQRQELEQRMQATLLQRVCMSTDKRHGPKSNGTREQRSSVPSAQDVLMQGALAALALRPQLPEPCLKHRHLGTWGTGQG